MFVAVGFPTAGREDGAELIYLGKDKAAMQKAIDAAVEGKKFHRIGKLIHPLFQKSSMEAVRVVRIDCSPENNAEHQAQKRALLLGATPEEAAAEGAVAKVEFLTGALQRAKAGAAEAAARAKAFKPAKTADLDVKRKLEFEAEAKAGEVEKVAVNLETAKAVALKLVKPDSEPDSIDETPKKTKAKK